MTKRIFFTGGGSAGHVTPNIALIEQLDTDEWEAFYVGSADGIERGLIDKLEIPYLQIFTGKYRRYFSWRNFLDPFLVLMGTVQSLLFCLIYKPDIVFSKGGFVAVPVVIGAWIARIPIISHESDITPGLASKLCFPFSKRICVSFPHTEKFLSRRAKNKLVVTGSPVRQSLLDGDARRGRAFLGLSAKKPLLLVFGGSLGAKSINDCVRRSRFQLLRKFSIIHVVGEGNLESEYRDDSYVQKEYLEGEFGDVIAAADLVISRAGANSIYELLLMRKCHLLIPLSRKASRGEQIVNARTFQQIGMSLVLREEDLTPENLIASVDQLNRERRKRQQAMQRFRFKDGVSLISKLINKTAKKAK